MTISKNITTIYDYTFENCFALKTISIPSNVTSIGKYAFAGCAFESITLPNVLELIDISAFNSCDHIKTNNVPASVTSIGQAAFANCDLLETITVDSNNPNYVSVDGMLYSKDLTTVLSVPANWQKEFVLLDSVTTIGDYAFLGNINLKTYTIPTHVTTLGDSAFGGCAS